VRKIVVILFILFLLAVVMARPVGCSDSDPVDFDSDIKIDTIKIGDVYFKFAQDDKMFNSTDYTILQTPSKKSVWLFKTEVTTKVRWGLFPNVTEEVWINPAMGYAAKYVEALDNSAKLFANNLRSYEGINGYLCGLDDAKNYVTANNEKVLFNLKPAFGGKTIQLTSTNVGSYEIGENSTFSNTFGLLYKKSDLPETQRIQQEAGSVVPPYTGPVKKLTLEYHVSGRNKTLLLTFDGTNWKEDNKLIRSLDLSDYDNRTLNLLTKLRNRVGFGEDAYIKGLKAIYGEFVDNADIELELGVEFFNQPKINMYNYSDPYYSQFEVVSDKGNTQYGMIIRKDSGSSTAGASGNYPINKISVSFSGFGSRFKEGIWEYSFERGSGYWKLTDKPWWDSGLGGKVSLRAWLNLKGEVGSETLNVLFKQGDYHTLPKMFINNKDWASSGGVVMTVLQDPITDKEMQEYVDKYTADSSAYKNPELFEVPSGVFNIDYENRENYDYYSELKRVIKHINPPTEPTVLPSRTNYPIKELEINCNKFSWLADAQKFKFDTLEASTLGGVWKYKRLISKSWQPVEEAVKTGEEGDGLNFRNELIPLARTLRDMDYENGVLQILNMSSNKAKNCYVGVVQEDPASLGTLQSKIKINPGEFIPGSASSKYFFRNGAIYTKNTSGFIFFKVNDLENKVINIGGEAKKLSEIAQAANVRFKLKKDLSRVLNADYDLVKNVGSLAGVSELENYSVEFDFLRSDGSIIESERIGAALGYSSLEVSSVFENPVDLVAVSAGDVYPLELLLYDAISTVKGYFVFDIQKNALEKKGYAFDEVAGYCHVLKDVSGNVIARSLSCENKYPGKENILFKKINDAYGNEQWVAVLNGIIADNKNSFKYTWEVTIYDGSVIKSNITVSPDAEVGKTIVPRDLVQGVCSIDDTVDWSSGICSSAVPSELTIDTRIPDEILGAVIPETAGEVEPSDSITELIEALSMGKDGVE